MAIKQKHIVTESELCHMINDAIHEVILESWTYNDMFGIKTSRENRINAIKYARQYPAYVKSIQAIADEVTRRVNLLQGASQVNEVAGAIVKGGLKTFGKKAAKAVGITGLASIPAFIAGPQNIQSWVQSFSANRAQARPKEVITAYDELTKWMTNICNTLQENPAVIGAVALQDSTLNGPEEVESGPMFDVADGVELAASIGMYAIPYVGWALGAIDLAHSLVHAGAEANKEGLQTVANQIKYLNTAIADVNKALNYANDPGIRQKIAQQQQSQQNQPQLTQQRRIPQGYVIGRPAPFAQNDPQQVQRLQNYLGLRASGQWDRNTQIAWDNWLRQTYQS